MHYNLELELCMVTVIVLGGFCPQGPGENCPALRATLMCHGLHRQVQMKHMTTESTSNLTNTTTTTLLGKAPVALAEFCSGGGGTGAWRMGSEVCGDKIIQK